MEPLDNIMDSSDQQPRQPDKAYRFIKNMGVLLGLILIGVLIAGILSIIVGMIWGYDVVEMASVISALMPETDSNLIRSIVSVNQLFTFLIPGIITALIIYKKNWLQLLFLNQNPGIKISFLAILILLCALPLVQFSLWLNQQVPLPNYLMEQEATTEALLKLMLTYDSPVQLLVNLLIIAVLPALGEEIVFRGLIQKNLQWMLKSGHLAIWISAIIFSAIHFQFAGFLPRMLLGAILGYLFYYTNNLWVPIVAHFFNNAAQVLADFFYKKEMSNLDVDNMESVPWYFALISLALVLALFYWLKKSRSLLNE